MTVARFSPDGLEVYVGTSAGDIAIFNLRTKVVSINFSCHFGTDGFLTCHSLSTVRNSLALPLSSTSNLTLLDGEF